MSDATISRLERFMPPPHYRRNLALLIGDYVFFNVALAFMSDQSVLPSFVGQLTGSEVLVGLVGVMLPLGWVIPQLAIAPRVARANRKKPWVIRPGIVGRVVVFLIAGAIALLGVENPAPVLVIFLLGYATFAICDGMSSVGWIDLLGRVLPNVRRGRLFAIGRAVSGLLIAFGISEVVRYILDPATGPDYPNDFALLFALAGVGMTLSLASFSLIREEPKPHSSAVNTICRREYFTYLRHVLRHDAPFRHYLLTRVVFALGGIATPFYIRFATEGLGIPSEDAVSGAIQINTLSAMVAGLLMGWLNERYGSRPAILIGSVALVTQPVMALIAGTGPSWVIFLTFAATGVVVTSFGLGFLTWIIEYAGDDRRAVYFSLASTFVFFGVMSPIFGGVIAEQTSYQTLFAIALVIAVSAMALSLRLVESRTVQSPEFNLQPVEAE